MALRTKWGYAEEILNSLQAEFRNRDLKIDPREVLLKLDAMVNEAAKAGMLENWKRYGDDLVDEQYLTTWEDLTVTDPANKGMSYVTIPAHYVPLPDNRGIDQVYFMNSFTSTKKKYFDPVIITSFKDISSYRNTIGEYLEERISCYPKNGVLVFDRGEINAKYGTIGMRLVVRDSGAIGDSDPYPIPADKENYIINNLVDFYRLRLAQPQDNVRDATSLETRQ